MAPLAPAQRVGRQPEHASTDGTAGPGHRVHVEPRPPVPSAAQPGVPRGLPAGRLHHVRQQVRLLGAGLDRPAHPGEGVRLGRGAELLRVPPGQPGRPRLSAGRGAGHCAAGARAHQHAPGCRSRGRRALAVDELRQRPGRDCAGDRHHQRRQDDLPDRRPRCAQAGNLDHEVPGSDAEREGVHGRRRDHRLRGRCGAAGAALDDAQRPGVGLPGDYRAAPLLAALLARHGVLLAAAPRRAGPVPSAGRIGIGDAPASAAVSRH